MSSAFDPFLSAHRAASLGVELVTLEQILERADVITVHTPMTPQTKDVVSRAVVQAEEGRPHHQLRARRPGRRAGGA